MKLFLLLVRWAAVFALTFVIAFHITRLIRHTFWFRERLYHQLLAGDSDQKLHAASLLASVGGEEQLLRALKEPDASVHDMARRGVEHLWFYSAGQEAYRLMEAAYQAAEDKHEPEALQILDTLVRKYPKYAEGWNRRAAVLWQVGEHEKSRHDCEQALKLNPNHYGAWQGLGVCQLQVGELAEACQSLRSALRIAPHDESTQRSLQQCEQLLRSYRPANQRERAAELL